MGGAPRRALAPVGGGDHLVAAARRLIARARTICGSSSTTRMRSSRAPPGSGRTAGGGAAARRPSSARRPGCPPASSVAAHGLGQTAGQRESEAEPGGVRCPRAAGTAGRPGPGLGGGDAGAAVDDPQLHAVTDRGRADQRRFPGAVPRALATTLTITRSSRPGSTSDRPGAAPARRGPPVRAPPRGRRAPGATFGDPVGTVPDRQRPAWSRLRSSRLSTSAVSRSSASSAVSSSSWRSSSGRVTSRLRGPETTALAPPAGSQVVADGGQEGGAEPVGGVQLGDPFTAAPTRRAARSTT